MLYKETTHHPTTTSNKTTLDKIKLQENGYDIQNSKLIAQYTQCNKEY
jgi:hypothetical protein